MNLEPSDFGGLFSYQRCVVVGANGAGKTWLAFRLVDRFKLPLIHNDALSLQTSWVQRDRAEVAVARDRIAAGDRWLIEGGPSILSGVVRDRAEVIIWLDVPRAIRLRRVMWRSLRYVGQERPEHPSGNRDWPGLRQLRFILKTWTRDMAMRRKIQINLQGCPARVIRITHKAQVDALLASTT